MTSRWAIPEWLPDEDPRLASRWAPKNGAQMGCLRLSLRWSVPEMAVRLAPRRGVLIGTSERVPQIA